MATVLSTTQVHCEHPVILVHPNIRWFARYSTRAVVRGKTYKQLVGINPIRFADFSPKKLDIQLNEVDSCYFVNDETGEVKPMYLVVPCGHCDICRDRKYREYMGRAQAETNRWSEMPLFITFTYDDNHLPEDGLNKRDIQLFLKRLRFRLENYGHQNRLRYIVCGEYGKNTHRAHYHMLLWNFPMSEFSNNISKVQRFINRCWSVYKVEFDQVKQKYCRVRCKDSEGKVMTYPSGKYMYETEQIGFTMVKPLLQGGAGYVCKYMRKDAEIPAGKNPTFFCSSNRGGGIGSEFIRSMKDDFAKNPEMTVIDVPDKTSGRVIHMPVASYCKTVLCPPASRVLKKKQYETVKRFYYNLELFRGVCNRLRDYDLLNLDRYDYCNDVKKHYYDDFMDITKHKTLLRAISATEWFKHPLFGSYESLTFIKTPEQAYNYVLPIYDELTLDAQAILTMQAEFDYICARESIMIERQKRLSELYQDAESYNLEAVLQKIAKDKERAAAREVL